jgi:hypothetical protein
MPCRDSPKSFTSRQKPREEVEGASMIQTKLKRHDYHLSQEAMNALRLEEAAKDVLRDPSLTAEDRAVMENAVRIARILQKAPKSVE